MAPAEDTERRIEEARHGSREALGQLLEACRGYLLLIAQREMDPDLRAKGGASDLVQQTFLEAQRDFTDFRGTTEAELLGWLRQILLHNLASFSRKFRETSQRRLAAEVSLEPDRLATDRLRAGTPTPEEQAIAEEEAQRVREALARLPEDYCQAILLHQEGRSFEEIGQALGRTPNGARKLWLRAIEHLQRELSHPPGGSTP